MGCLKLTYDQEVQGLKNCFVFIGGRIAKKEQPLKKRDDYMPFGLTFNSYTSGTKNNYLYNQGSKMTFQGLEGKEFKTERQPELQVDLTKYRAYDYALGRWWQVDPMADSLEWQSPYSGMDNNPIRYNDPNGDCPLCISAGVGALIGGVAGAVIASMDENATAESIATAALGGAVSGAIIGSGAGLIATTAVGSSVAGVVATNAAAGLVAGAAESVTVQAIEGEGINTAEVVEAGAASMFANVVAGPVGGAIEGKIAKEVSSTVASSVAQNTAKVAVDVVGKAVENEIQEVLD